MLLYPFYNTFPIHDAVRRELSWTHYRLRGRIQKSEARSFYEVECIKANWSTRELERQRIEQERGFYNILDVITEALIHLITYLTAFVPHMEEGYTNKVVPLLPELGEGVRG
jgi:hypothetical protein